MIVFLNVGDNCHDHTAEWERYDAYYDLGGDRVDEVEWLQGNMVSCVIRYVDNDNKQGDVVLAFWRHREILMLPHERWGETQVFVGERIGEFQIAKSELKKHPQFKDVLNRDGNFNRFSVKLCRNFNPTTENGEQS